MKSTITCAYCGAVSSKEKGGVTRSKKRGLPLFCNRKCSGLAKRKGKTADQKREEKRIYDECRRIILAARIKATKAAYNKRTYDPAKAAIVRKARSASHAEYCRRTEYRTWKSKYDLNRRALEFGEYAETYMLLHDIDVEIGTRMSRYEIYSANKTLNKALKRKTGHAY